ncbi:MAG: lipase maturation factor family protein [Deltaproteobacteria bacterium]|nr:lipase maturation factor family protein [Deltaproteobacteria bacterium]
MTDDADLTGDPRPLLVYDGRCGFCRRWIPRWRQLTGDRVRYAPFLGADAPNPLPEVAPAALEGSVHLRLPDGRVVAGAAAVAELGAFTASGPPVFRWVYRHVPGAAAVAELGYRAVSAVRPVANALTAALVGPDLRRPRQTLARWLFLRVLGLTALCAFVSWWTQCDGLIGTHGIEPARDYLVGAVEVAAKRGWSDLELFHQLPTLAWLGPDSGALNALCAVGTAGSALLLLNVLPGVGLALAWVCYLSLVSVGQTFMGYQWDALLLESLVAAAFLVPWRGVRPGLAGDRAPSWAGVWLVRLLVLKLMFMSGWVKLASHDPVWADMSALDYHYWTQPLPTFTAFWAHHAPAWTRELAIRLMFAVELVLPWFIVSGLRRPRYLAGAGALALMLAIGSTGNYGYFNLLAATLAIMVFDDGALRALVPRRWRGRVPDTHLLPYARPPLARRAPVALLAGLVAFVSASAVVVATHRRSDEPPPELFADVARFMAPFHVAGSYGLFATMTTDRPEITLEGSRDGVTWRPYRFAWKMEALDEAPGFTGPHMPRLDWQMWFAALRGDCRRTRWYLPFLQRLLEGEPAVVGLLAEDPFPDGPPRYLRSRLWHYEPAPADAWHERGQWWQREAAEQDFCPTVTLERGDLVPANLPAR